MMSSTYIWISDLVRKYLRKYENTYFILQNKYLCIYEDGFGAKKLRDEMGWRILQVNSSIFFQFWAIFDQK